MTSKCLISLQKDFLHGILSSLCPFSSLGILNVLNFKRSSIYNSSYTIAKPSKSSEPLQPATMPSLQKYSATTAILAALLHSANFASSQTTVSPNYASESPSIYQEYNFTYPTYATDQTILTSYKDSIDVSWTSIAPHHPPTLSIECWIRNATTSPICTCALMARRFENFD